MCGLAVEHVSETFFEMLVKVAHYRQIASLVFYKIKRQFYRASHQELTADDFLQSGDDAFM